MPARAAGVVLNEPQNSQKDAEGLWPAWREFCVFCVFCGFLDRGFAG
jgi:hypothetical protein